MDVTLPFSAGYIPATAKASSLYLASPPKSPPGNKKVLLQFKDMYQPSKSNQRGHSRAGEGYGLWMGMVCRVLRAKQR